MSCSNFSLTPIHYITYFTVYTLLGIGFNTIGQVLEIARFASTYQIITCYTIYLVTVSILVRDKDWRTQYLMGIFFLAWIEILGYSELHLHISKYLARYGGAAAVGMSLPHSIAYENNIIDRIVTPRNFTLVMSLMFALLLPVGNGIVGVIASLLGANENQHSEEEERRVFGEKDATQRLITEYISPRKQLKEE